MAPPRAPNRSAQRAHGVLIISAWRKFPPDAPDLCEGWLDTLSVAGYRLRHRGTRCDAVIAVLRF